MAAPYSHSLYVPLLYRLYPLPSVWLGSSLFLVLCAVLPLSAAALPRVAPVAVAPRAARAPTGILVSGDTYVQQTAIWVFIIHNCKIRLYLCKVLSG